MNTVSGFPYQCIERLIILLLVPVYSAFAQSDNYYQPPTKPQNGYWQLSANLDNRSTMVSFFDDQGQLLYQEKLAGYYLKDSRRTTHLLDSLLSSLVKNQLVSSQLQSQLIPFPTTAKPIKRSYDSERPDSLVVGTDTSLVNLKNRIHCSINPSGVIRLNLLNPENEPLTIRLTDDWGHAIYHNVTTEQEYYSRLNVASLTNGKFLLSVLDKGGKVLYRFRLTKSTQTQFDLQSIAQDKVCTRLNSSKTKQ